MMAMLVSGHYTTHVPHVPHLQAVRWFISIAGDACFTIFAMESALKILAEGSMPWRYIHGKLVNW